MKMQKTDIGVVVFMYAVCGFFYAYSSKLSDTSRTYPKFTIALLFFLTSFYLVQMILNAPVIPFPQLDKALVAEILLRAGE